MNIPMLNCVIIDDEPLATEGLTSYLREVDFLRLVGTCENPLELPSVMDEHAVDLIFLDIQMPKMSGLDFLRTMQNPPMVVITTAFPSYALEGFQLNVLDYLLKPIMFDRFFKAAAKARDYYQLTHKGTSTNLVALQNDYFFIKCGNKYERIFITDILFIEGMQNYVTIYTLKGKYITLQHLKNWEQHLDGKLFMRVHKSYIVAKNKIDKIEGGSVYIGQHCVPVSRAYRDQVIDEVVNNKLYR